MGRLSGALSLRIRLALAFGLLAGALAFALSLVIGRFASDAARDEISRHLAQIAAQYRDKLDNGITERLGDAAALAYLDTATPDGASPERRMARIEQLMRNKDFAWAGYIDPAGRVTLASGGVMKGEDLSGRPWFRAARRAALTMEADENTPLSKLLPVIGERRRFVALTVPVDGGRGVVGAALHLAFAERLRAQTQRDTRARDLIELLLVQGDGDVLLGPDGLIGKKVPLPVGSRVGAPAALDRWADGQEYLAGGSVMRGTGDGAGLGWAVIAREPAQAAFEPVRALQRAILWAGVALALIGIGAGWLLATRLARPLEQLAHAAQAVAKGELRASLPQLEDNLEMARLSEALRAMLAHLREQAESLREAQDSLDQRVRERTAELVKLQAQLELEIADTMVARDDASRAHEQLALALDASRLALWDFDVQRDQIFLSQSWSKMLGGPAVDTRVSSGELVKLVPEAHRERVLAHVRDVVSGRLADYRIEHPVTRQDGSEFWVVSVGRVVERDASGKARRILGTNRDITERTQATLALRASERRFRLAFENPAVGVALVAPDGRFQAVNRTMQKMLGYTEEEFLATTFLALTHPEDVALNRQLVDEALRGERDAYEYEKRFVRKDGTPLWVQVNVALVRDELGLPLQLVCQILDVTARREAEEKIKALALHDPLTGLPNQRLLHDRLDRALASARREKKSVGVLYLDLDGFKPVNDRLGHAAGDRVLIETARRARAALRESDTFARAGGDEFVAVLPGAGRQEAARSAERLLAALSEPYQVEGQPATVGASIGVALSSPELASPEALLRAADAAMYEAKRAGRNRICFHPSTKETPQ